MSTKKNIYVVLGMARSGTSATARGLAALGIDFGEKLEAANKLWNPKGFWEDLDIVFKINRGVMFALNYTWMSVNTIDALCRNNKALDGLKKSAIEILTERMVATQHWGFKDPRTAKLLPFWQDVFKLLDLNDQYVISLRNPLASAYSYQRVGGGVDIEVGMLLWLMHLIPAIEGTHGKKRVMVHYDLLLKEPRAELERIQRELNIPMLSDQAAIDTYANDFLDKSLQHYEYHLEDLKSHPATAVSPICIKMYEFFLKLARDEISFESAEFSTAWRALKAEFEAIYPIYCYLDVILKRNKQQERELRTIRKSIPWKLSYPLRVIDNFFRSRRRKARSERRLVKSYE